MRTVEDAIREHQINEVLHFTTSRGLIGTLASEGLKSRELLREDEYLESIFTPNANRRKDLAHLNYVSLSITHLNHRFFSISKSWKATQEVWWCAVSLDPVVLTHPGVLFVTTNNMYTGAQRAADAAGLDALFADPVLRYIEAGKLTNPINRTVGMSTNLTTCPQAEALYPGVVPRQYINRIYVSEPRHADIANTIADVTLVNNANMGTIPANLEVVIAPEVFTPQR